ncbi:MAG TPA: sensor domain-containing diguanylate cyclase [Bradyrhizobium sp.]|uniref:sensor domain-containing diguanylate cyclase n=1 Tax=Bradyrhizobium sp. TaxID=376 RepID=UPI002D806051|nr:sensor domain-containing diguanylate cyclase [Bradyrhizobium sp.]HET7888265.1 sensor domain-containing diguanylate cyclase [Bradyrhizobium sp.]
MANEQDRLAALDHYDVLDTPAEEAFDRITRLVRGIFGVSMSTVTLIDGHRQWFKSQQGMPNAETERGPALCNAAIQYSRPLVVPDTWHDKRFADNPFVTGAPFIRFYAGVQLRSPEGHAIGTLCAMHDQPKTFDAAKLAILADLAKTVTSELELRTVATRDALTGALSRRALREELSRAISLARRHRFELSCIFFDLDHFKSVNDAHGHGIGDQVLRACVEACRGELRSTDSIGRFGGEEFVVLLPHTGGEAALAVAEKIRSAVARSRVETEAGHLRVTASFGVAALDGGDIDVDQFIKRADTALYAAKAAGRNNCQIWQSAEAADPGLLRRVLKAGQITFNGGRSTVECTIRGLSRSGALLQVISTAGVPERFKLGVVSDELHRMCRIATKRDTQIEVVFE